jgi:hypothetical protein
MCTRQWRPDGEMGHTRTYGMHVSEEMPGFTVVQPMPLAFPSLHSGGSNSFFFFLFRREN